MTSAATSLIAAFEASAKAAQAAEDELRKAMADKVARLERQRAFAFRRTRLVRLLAGHSGTPESKPEEVWQAQRRAVRDELGWTGASEVHEAILARLQPVGAAVRDHLFGEEGTEPPDVKAELEAFEAWFEGAHSKSFYALFDQYFPEGPVVDF
jgi:hypothetical protein